MKEKKFIRNNPQLPVRNLRETLDYYREKLGFYDEWTWTNEDGEEKDGGIRRDDLRLLFGEDPAFTETINCGNNKRLSLMWFVDNVEEVLAEWQSRGIPLADNLKIHGYGLKEFAFIDINGFYIRVAEGAGK